MTPRRFLAPMLVLTLAALVPPGRAVPPGVYRNPLDVTVSPDGKTARVALAGPKAVAVVDLATGRVIAEEPWPADQPPPDPEAPTRRLPPRARTGFEAAGQSLPDAVNLRALAALPSRPFIDFALAVHQQANSAAPAPKLLGEWVFTNALTLAPLPDLANKGYPLSQTAPLDQPPRHFADPADLVVTADGTTAYVACAGADAVLVVDVAAFRDLVGKQTQARYKAEGAVPRHLALDRTNPGANYLKAVVPTAANPRRLALTPDGRTLIVSCHLADALTVIDAVKFQAIRQIPLGGPPPDAARRGAVLFHSAALTLQGQFSCASCHPGGGADGLTWDLPRDGEGNPKNTKALWGCKDTAPYGWLGTSPTLADRVSGTLRTLHRHAPTPDQVADLVAYLETLAPPAPPPAADPAAVDRGRQLFLGAGRCHACHQPPTYQDGLTHDVGTGTAAEARFKTPSLRGAGRTAPYLHDGRAATLEEVLAKHNPHRRHGDGHRLGPAELADVAAFLRSL